jgi:hypothetical protein
MQNEPNSRRGRVGGGPWGPWAERQVCKTKPISGSKRAKRTQSRPAAGVLTGENMRNEAKLGWTGAYGKRGLSCGARLGRGVKCAKRTQSRPAAGVLTGENMRNEAKLGANGGCGQRGLSCGARLGGGVKCAKRTQFAGGGPQHEGNRAKRTQFGPGRPRTPEGECAKRTQSRPAAGGCRRPDVQNEANWAPPRACGGIVQDEPNLPALEVCP